MYQDSPIGTILKGAMAGIVGTMAINLAMSRGPELMQQMGLMKPQAQPETPPPPVNPDEPHTPTEKLADKVSAGVLEQPLHPGARKFAGQALQWGYGAMWGALYGVLENSFRMPSFVHGAIFGSAVGIVGATALPAMGLTPASENKPMGMDAMQLANHLVYGWVTAAVFHLLSRDA